MQLTVIPIVIGVFGTVTKGLLKGLKDIEVGGRVETIQTTVIFWSVDAFQGNAFQGNAPEGSDTFWWQLWEEIAWAEMG